MNSEYEILSHLEKNRDTSQRQIAGKTGLSLGTVNLLLKKMVRKGLVKIERLNARTLRYIITPRGMAEKTMLAYQYMKISYQRILKISQALEKVVADHEVGGDKIKEVIFYGPQDEVLEILKMAAGSLCLKYILMSSMDKLNEYLSIKSKSEHNRTYSESERSAKYLLIIWAVEVDCSFSKDAEVINILNQI